MQNQPTSYDSVIYPSYTHPQTHPDRLAVIGSLFGLEPAPVSRCRVLELGCGNGTNLVPMAWGLPQSEFVGIDLAALPIARGRRMSSELGLKNVQLVQADLLQVTADWGKFDYIIAHGLYSWVPGAVQKHILALCRELLAAQGIAFISYNALPGFHLRNMVREMMRFHTRGFESADEKVRQAMALVKFLANAQDTSDEYRLWLKAELDQVAEHSAGHLYHDELAEINEPVYFTQFMDRAAAHGLQYLGEADFFEMSDHVFNPEVRQTLQQLGRNRLLREQYLDFLKCRRFRQTLLCHGEARLLTEPRAEKVAEFLISSANRFVDGAADLRSGVNSSLVTAKGATFETDFGLGKATLAILEAAWPAPIPFADLFKSAVSRLNQEGAVDADAAAAKEGLCGFLLRLYSAGIVEFRVSPPVFARDVNDRPVVSPVVRWQVRESEFVTSAFHVAVKVEDEIGRSLLSWLDGTLDRQALLEKLWLFLKSRNALVTPEGGEAAARRELEVKLEQNLAKLARLGLLVG